MTSSSRPPVSGAAVLLANSVTIFFLTMILSGVNVALPAIGRDFGADVVTLGWVSTAGLVTSASALIPFGRIADIVGIRRIYTYGVMLYTLTCIATPFANSIGMLIGTRAIQGISVAMVVGNATAMISNVFPPGLRGRALGINTSSVYAGLALGPLLGGFLTQTFGWRSIFIMNIPVGLISLALVLWKIRAEWRGGQGEKLDVPGAIIFSLAFASLMYGISSLDTTAGITLAPLGALLLAVFVWWENRTPAPLISISLFRRNRIFVFSNFAALVSYASTYATVYLLSLYLQDVRGLSPSRAGLVLLAQPAVQALVSPLAGRLSDKVEPRIVSSMGMSLSCVALISLAFVTATTHLYLVVGILVIAGLGLALFVSPNTNAVMTSVDPKVFGIAAATINTMRQIGQMLSMGISMLILTMLIGRVQITSGNALDFVTAARICFAIFAILSVTAIYASAARGKVQTLQTGRFKAGHP